MGGAMVWEAIKSYGMIIICTVIYYDIPIRIYIGIYIGSDTYC
jgi:hypothetical protein